MHMIFQKALPKRSKSDRKYATDEATRHCHIRVRSRRRRDAGTETVDSNDGGGDHFVARMESMERNLQKKLAHARGENEYNVLLDKKMCSQCGMTQPYAEFRDKKKMCQSCGVMFQRDQVCSDVEQRFFMRIHDTSRRKEKQRYRVEDQHENCKIQPKKSCVQKDYEKKLMKRHETHTLFDRNYRKSPSVPKALKTVPISINSEGL
uniref:Uncharacterized protein AlNc14C474G11847 n=1 Tax=Albugo laibachii Nc14 TaxID=890382 RepID=F0X0B0_9STRA|nr:conserved hypothetical protein [Albugo laibachii Nc14]|eukprot:CCA27193.1 conserved hypothetical protein [Albugo laibachii Nc14]